MRPPREPEPLDLERWPRRQHFEFFRRYEWPWFSLCAEVDVTRLVRRCREPDGPSFFLASLWISLAAANGVAELRYRLRGEQVVVHPAVHGGSTVLLPDETFAFGYFDYEPDFPTFASAAGAVLDGLRAGSGALEPHPERDDLIHHSVIPWVAFTSFSHARTRASDLSVPKIVFGRHHAVGDRRSMPVSVEVHHALVDGIHVGRFYRRFEELAGEPERLG